MNRGTAITPPLYVGLGIILFQELCRQCAIFLSFILFEKKPDSFCQIYCAIKTCDVLKHKHVNYTVIIFYADDTYNVSF